MNKGAAGHIFGQNPFVPLHQTLCGKPVVVKAKGVKHVAALHTAVAGDHFRLGVRKNMADMQLSADCGRRRVDGVERPFFVRVKTVDLFLFPKLLHLLFNGFKMVAFFHG